MMINLITKVTLFLTLFMSTTTVSAQFIYEKKFRDGIVSIRFDRYTGPITISIKTIEGSKIDTLTHDESIVYSLFGYEVNDTYLCGDTLLLASSNLRYLTGGRISLSLKKKDGWTWQLFRANLLESTDLEKSHSIQFIDSKSVKTIVDGVKKMYELDYKEMKTKLITKQE